MFMLWKISVDVWLTILNCMHFGHCSNIYTTIYFTYVQEYEQIIKKIIVFQQNKNIQWIE